jgi:hypothetical protein
VPIIQPNADDIVREGFHRVAGREPSSDEIERGVRVWMEEALSEIWQLATHEDVVRFKVLENTATLLLERGRRRYGWPDDFHRPIEATLLRARATASVYADTVVGEKTIGTSAPTSTLPAVIGETVGNNYVLAGHWLVVTSGDSAGALREVRQIAGAGTNPFLYQILLDDVWVEFEAPVEDDTFAICDGLTLTLDEEMVSEHDRVSYRAGTGRPMRVLNFDGQMVLDIAPSEEMLAVQLRYWSNPTRIEKTSPVMQRIMREWRVPLTAAMKVRAAETLDDSRLVAFREEWATAAKMLVEQAYDYGPAFEGFTP